MKLIPDIMEKEHEQVMEIWEASFSKISYDLLTAIGFSLAPTFNLHQPKPTGSTEKIVISNAIRQAIGGSYNVKFVPRSEIAAWKYTNLNVHLEKDLSSLRQHIADSFHLCYRNSVNIIASDSWFTSPDPPATWKPDPSEKQRYLWRALRDSLYETMMQTAICLKTSHDGLYLPLLELYKQGCYPFGLGAELDNTEILEDHERFILVFCSEE